MRTLIVAISLVTVLFGCKTIQPYNPYKIEKLEILSMGKKLGMLPSNFTGFENPEKKAAFFDNELVRVFEENGFEIIPYLKWQEVYGQIKDKAGDLFSSKTGKPNIEKLNKIREQAIRKYQDQYNVDGFVYSGVIRVKARWSGNSAKWDGNEEAATGKEGFWASFNAPRAYGTIGALSYFINIEDAKGQDIYIDYGGLQLIHNVIQNFLDSEFVDISEKLLLTDENKNKRSIKLATCRFFEIWNSSTRKQTKKRGKAKRCIK